MASVRRPTLEGVRINCIRADVAAPARVGSAGSNTPGETSGCSTLQLSRRREAEQWLCPASSSRTNRVSG